jgi:hypothetical protein
MGGYLSMITNENLDHPIYDTIINENHVVNYKLTENRQIDYTPQEYKNMLNSTNSIDTNVHITFSPHNTQHIRDVNSIMGQLNDVFF